VHLIPLWVKHKERSKRLKGITIISRFTDIAGFVDKAKAVERRLVL
jgi:hypothetical protein